jgi:hypothetical protein
MGAVRALVREEKDVMLGDGDVLSNENGGRP